MQDNTIPDSGMRVTGLNLVTYQEKECGWFISIVVIQKLVSGKRSWRPGAIRILKMPGYFLYYNEITK